MNKTITSLPELLELVKMLCKRHPTAKDNWRHGLDYVYSGDYYLTLRQGQEDFLLQRKGRERVLCEDAIGPLLKAGVQWSMAGTEISVLTHNNRRVACFLPVV